MSNSCTERLKLAFFIVKLGLVFWKLGKLNLNEYGALSWLSFLVSSDCEFISNRTKFNYDFGLWTLQTKLLDSCKSKYNTTHKMRMLLWETNCIVSYCLIWIVTQPDTQFKCVTTINVLAYFHICITANHYNVYIVDRLQIGWKADIEVCAYIISGHTLERRAVKKGPWGIGARGVNTKINKCTSIFLIPSLV